MTHNRRVMIACTILLLLVLSSLSIARSTFALNPELLSNQTLLDVRQPGGQAQWGRTRTIHALHTVTFRWKTSAPGTAYAEWQIMDYKPAPNGSMNETPFARTVVAVPALGEFQPFTIDFAQLQQLHPNMIPAAAPANAKDYYLRLVPWKTMDMTDPANISGDISDTVKITYVKSPPPQPDPPTFDYSAIFWTGGHYVDLGYSTNKPVIPIVTVSKSAPVKDAKGNPAFSKNAKIVYASLPFLSGYEKDGEVELRNLRPKTHYHYIIMAKDENGQKAYKTGQFTTAKRFVNVAFEKIFMSDDSDGGPSGAGDLNFAFFVNDVNILGSKKTIPQNGQMDFSTGETKDFNLVETVEDAPDLIVARVNGHDTDDCGDFFHHPLCYCQHVLSITSPTMVNGHCKDGSGESSTAIATLHIPDVTDRSQFGIEFQKKEFTMYADNGNLRFKVFGSFTVRYK